MELVNLDEVCAELGRSKSHVYKLRQGDDFPKPERLKPLYWKLSDIEDYVENQKEKISKQNTKKLSESFIGGELREENEKLKKQVKQLKENIKNMTVSFNEQFQKKNDSFVENVDLKNRLHDYKNIIDSEEWRGIGKTKKENLELKKEITELKISLDNCKKVSFERIKDFRKISKRNLNFIKSLVNKKGKLKKSAQKKINKYLKGLK